MQDCHMARPRPTTLMEGVKAASRRETLDEVKAEVERLARIAAAQPHAVGYISACRDIACALRAMDRE